MASQVQVGQVGQVATYLQVLHPLVVLKYRFFVTGPGLPRSAGDFGGFGFARARLGLVLMVTMCAPQ